MADSSATQQAPLLQSASTKGWCRPTCDFARFGVAVAGKQRRYDPGIRNELEDKVPMNGAVERAGVEPDTPGHSTSGMKSWMKYCSIGDVSPAQMRTCPAHMLAFASKCRKEKAQEQLASLRKAEVNAKHHFKMLKHSLEDQLKFDNKDKDDETSAKTTSLEARAVVESDVVMTGKGLADSKASFESTEPNCTQLAEDHNETSAKTIAAGKGSS